MGFKKSMVLTGMEREGGRVQASVGFNREKVWTVKRKWVVLEHFSRVVGALLEFKLGQAGRRLCEFWVTGVGLCAA